MTRAAYPHQSRDFSGSMPSTPGGTGISPGAVRAEIRASWQRSLLAGLRPDQIEVPYQPDAVDAGLLVRAAAPVLDEAATELEGGGAALVLADERGRIVDRRTADHEVLVKADRLGIAAGFLFSEDAIGTNGIGTTIAEGTTVWVIGQEHFAEAFRGLACTGAPVAGPDGRLAGVVDLTVDSGGFHPAMVPLIRRIARDISGRLHETSPERAVTGWACLTEAERTVAEMHAQGLTARQIASSLQLRMGMVSQYLRGVYDKLGIGSRLELARVAAAAAAEARVMTAIDDARRQVERDLHDGVQQQLVALGLRIGSAELSLTHDDADLRGLFADIRTGLREVHEKVREISRGTHPRILSERGLAPALRGLTRHCPVPVNLTLNVPGRLPSQVEAGVYYMVSEALANVAKHAQASHVDVSVRVRGKVVRVSVADDGVSHRPGCGLRLGSLRERATALGGTLLVSRPRGGGLRVEATFLVTPPARDGEVARRT